MRGKKIRATLVALAATVALLASSQVAAAGPAPMLTSFTVNEVDKAGATQQIGTWTYDTTNHTLTASGTPAPFVQPLTATDYLGTSLPYLPYSGQDAYAGNTKMAVAMKGFYVADLAAWVSARNDVPLGGATAFNVAVADAPGVPYWATDMTLSGVDDDRYWYPSYNLSADPTTATWDDATRMQRKAVLAIIGNSGRRQQVTPANPTTYSDLLTALGNLATAGAAYDGNALQFWMGQVKGDHTEANLGGLGPKYVNALTFKPVYLTITANVVGAGGTGTVVTDDGYLKATAGEPVSFTVKDVTAGFEVADVTVWDADGDPVAVTESAGTYSYVMPATDATVNVTLEGDVDIAGASIRAIPAKVFTGKKIKPRLAVTYDGVKLTAGIDYRVTYGNNRLLGSARATITGMGSFSGTKSVRFHIIPSRTRIRKVNAGWGKAAVSWLKPRDAGGVSGFEVAYRAHGGSTYQSAGSTRRLVKVVRYLTPGVSYDIKVRAFKLIGGERHYGSWSRSLTATVK